MKLVQKAQYSLQALMLALTLNACAGDASLDEPIEGNEENAANPADEEGNDMGNENVNNGGNNENLGNENFGNENTGNNNAANTGEMNEPANEFVNNAAGENFLNAGGGNVAAEEPASNPTADAALAENSSEDLGIQPSDAIVGGNQNAAPEANAVPQDPSVGATDNSLAVPADSAPVPTAPAPVAPVAGGRVHYVVKGGASAYDKPSGQVVKTFEQGDHPLVTADGEWAQTADGMYIQRSSITTKPVSRAKSPKSWR